MEKVGFSLERMKRQINSRYLHGLVGIDYPSNIDTVLYEPLPRKSLKIR